MPIKINGDNWKERLKFQLAGSFLSNKGYYISFMFTTYTEQCKNEKHVCSVYIFEENILQVIYTCYSQSRSEVEYIISAYA
jgi:hypothetical protein